MFFECFDVVNLASFRSLWDNEIGPKGAIGLGMGLEKNTSLTELK